MDSNTGYVWYTVVMPKIVDDLFHQWQLGYKYGRGNFLWKLVLYAALWKWKLWLKRNNIVLRNKSNSADEVVQSTISSMSEWVRKRNEFEGVDLNDLNRSWAAMMHRYDMDMATTCHRHGKGIDFTHKKLSIEYETTRYVAHLEVS